MDQKKQILEEFDPLNKDSEASVEPKTLAHAIEEDDEPLYDFQLFVKQMKDPRADPLMRYTRSFLSNFATQRKLWTVKEQVKLINDFKIFIYDKFIVYEPFKSLDLPKLRNAKEGIEKLIMGKLYTRCFSPSLQESVSQLDSDHQLDLSRDDQLRGKILEYRFISPGNLEIPGNILPKLDTFVKLSGKELCKINNYRAPRDKMVCVLNSCKVIFGLLKHTKLAHGGADNFIPLLIYTILKSEIQSLVSNVNYIERFRLAEFLQGESSYYLSSLQGAINFILDMDEKSLKLEDTHEFEERYAQNKQSLEQEIQLELKKTSASTKKIEKVHSPSPSEYLLRPLDEAANSMFSKFSELLSSPLNKPSPTGHDTGSYSDDIDDSTAAALAQKMELEEHKNTSETLQAMFPDLDKDIIEDVCIAKKYRLGVCVDTLLALCN